MVLRLPPLSEKAEVLQHLTLKQLYLTLYWQPNHTSH